MSQTGIVVVTHNSEGVIGECLEAALASGAQVVVVDNASQDGTLAEVHERPAARLIANPWNRGFAGAANQGIQALDCSHVLLLNPDAVILGARGEGAALGGNAAPSAAGLARALEALVSACDEGTAAAGGKLVGADGAAQRGFVVRRLPTPAALVFEILGINRLWRGNPVNRRYRCLGLDLDRPGEVEQPAGAFLMVRREAWRALGGFDECFRPIWFEDVDFCARARQAGYRIKYVPEAVARHRGGHSVGAMDWVGRRLCWYDSLLRYSGKHLSPAAHRVMCLAVMLRSALGAAKGIVVLGRPHAVAVHGRIFRLALCGLVEGGRRARGSPWPGSRVEGVRPLL